MKIYKFKVQRQTQGPTVNRRLTQRRWPGGTMYWEVLPCWCWSSDWKYMKLILKWHFSEWNVWLVLHDAFFVVLYESTLQWCTWFNFICLHYPSL